MTADPFWQKFTHTVAFTTQAMRVKGTLEDRGEAGPKNDPYPVLLVRTESGYRLRVNVTQVRLVSELVRTRPAVGDLIEIVYHGPAPKAPPGMSPAKEFTVYVTKKDSVSPPPNGSNKATGEVDNKHDSEVGN